MREWYSIGHFRHDALGCACGGRCAVLRWMLEVAARRDEANVTERTKRSIQHSNEHESKDEPRRAHSKDKEAKKEVREQRNNRAETTIGAG